MQSEVVKYGNDDRPKQLVLILTEVVSISVSNKAKLDKPTSVALNNDQVTNLIKSGYKIKSISHTVTQIGQGDIASEPHVYFCLTILMDKD